MCIAENCKCKQISICLHLQISICLLKTPQSNFKA